MMKNKNKIIFIISIFFALCPQAAATSIDMVPATLTVPDVYPTIQEAIAASVPGDTVFVRSGTYHESITIDKQISLAGEGRETTIITGSGTGHVVYISSNGVEVSGFTIKGSGTNYIGPFQGGDAGIMLDVVTGCTISDTEVAENGIGIFLNESDDITLENNIVHDNDKDGIYGRYSDNNVIRGNRVSSNGGHGGIYLNPGNSYNLIENNIANHNIPEHGIKIQTNSNHNVLRNNTCLYNGDGIYLSDAHYNNITGNILSNSTLRNGIMLRLSENNIVSDNIIEYNPDHGLDLDFLNFNNTLENNNCSYNINGIALRLGSHHNKIVNNTCTSNERSGIEIEHSDYNEITHNTLSMNSNGINIMLIDSNPDNEWNSIAQWDFAMEKFKELVEERVARGIKIESEDSAGNEIHWNIIEGNSDFGINIEIPPDIDATNNWWGDASGPFHSQENPDGRGDEIYERDEGIVLFEPWLESSPAGEATGQKDVKKTEETQPKETTTVETEEDKGICGPSVILLFTVLPALLGYRFRK